MKSLLLVAVLLMQSASLEEARKQFKAGQGAAAFDLYKKVVTEQPALVEGHVEFIRLLLEANDVKGAIAVSANAASKLPQSAAVRAALGDVLFREGHVVEASRAYKQALEMDPNLARAWWGNGRIQRLSAQGNQARESFIKAYSLDPNDPDIVRDWAFTNKKPVEIAAGLDRHAELASYRGREYEMGMRAEAASLRYLGDKQACELATPAAPTTIQLQGALPVTGSFPVPLATFDVAMVGLVPWVNVSVEGSKGEKFTLNTFGDGITIYENTAKKKGITRVADLPTPGSYIGFVQRLNIGPLEFRNCPVTVISAQLPDNVNVTYDGSIGGGIFSNFLVTVNQSKRTLQLDPMPPLGEGEIAQWADAQNSRPGFSPMLRIGNAWFISATIEGQAPMLFSVNDASISSTVSRETAQDLLKTTKPKDFSINFAGKTRKATLNPRDYAQINRTLGVETAGQLGRDVLGRYIVTIDQRNGLIRLQ